MKVYKATKRLTTANKGNNTDLRKTEKEMFQFVFDLKDFRIFISGTQCVVSHSIYLLLLQTGSLDNAIQKFSLA